MNNELRLIMNETTAIISFSDKGDIDAYRAALALWAIGYRCAGYDNESSKLVIENTFRNHVVLKVP